MCTVLIIPIKEENIQNQIWQIKMLFKKCMLKKSKNNAVKYGCALLRRKILRIEAGDKFDSANAGLKKAKIMQLNIYVNCFNYPH